MRVSYLPPLRRSRSRTAAAARCVLLVAGLLVAACGPSQPVATPGSPPPPASPAAGSQPAQGSPSTYPSAAGGSPTLVPSPSPLSSSASSPASTQAGTVVLVGAGDIADCDRLADARATADLVRSLIAGRRGMVFTAGDNAYPNGSPTDFQRCYDSAWGSLKKRTRPAVGNHEYNTPGAAGYFAYFGPAAGAPGHAWYAYDLGAWRIYVLDSSCTSQASCARGSAQESWLQADLADNPRECVAAIWHHPRWSSGFHGSDARTADLVGDLYDAGAELILVGHDHDYERFAPQRPDGTRDDAAGIREFVGGTGGARLYPMLLPRRNSELRSSSVHGVLALTLEPGGYAWRFVPTEAGGFTDEGRGVCH